MCYRVQCKRCQKATWMGVCYSVIVKAVTVGVFWVFEHPRNFWQKFDAQKCRFKFIIMGSGPQ